MHLLEVFFFFQAEDGIRDTSVTGVQTCALPISSRKWVGDLCRKHNNLLVHSVLGEGLEENPNVVYAAGGPNLQLQEAVRYARTVLRSEERRVGKECRCRWARCEEGERLWSVCGG